MVVFTKNLFKVGLVLFWNQHFAWAKILEQLVNIFFITLCR